MAVAAGRRDVGRTMTDLAFLLETHGSRHDDGSWFGIAALGTALGVGLAGIGADEMAQSFDVPGWYGPAGIIGVAGSGMAVWVGSRMHRRVAQQRREVTEAQRFDGWVAGFLPRVHEPIWRLCDAAEARELWTAPKIGIGRPQKLDKEGKEVDAGCWPVVPRVSGKPVGADWRIENVPVGAQVTIELPEGGWSAGDVRDRCANLAASLDIPAVRVVGVDGNEVVLELRVADPIGKVLFSPLVRRVQVHDPDGSMRQVYTLTVRPGGLSCHDDVPIGMREDGHRGAVNFADGAHRAVQGATRSGKSVTMYSMILASVLMRDTVTMIIDPNAATVLPFWQVADYVCDSNNPKDATAMLNRVLAEMESRKEVFAAMRADRITRFSPELPLWNIFIDENSTFEDDKKYCATLKKVAKQVAKFGGRLTIADQKLSQKSLSTEVRVNLFDRISHRVEARQDFEHLFPGLPELAKEAANPTDPMAQGVSIARLSTHPAPMRMRSYLLPDSALWDVCDQIVAVRGAKRPPWGSGRQLTAGADKSITEPVTETPDTQMDHSSGVVLNFPGHAKSEEPAETDTSEHVEQPPLKAVCKLPGCQRVFPQNSGKGRRREYCTPAHRQEDYRRRKEAQ